MNIHLNQQSDGILFHACTPRLGQTEFAIAHARAHATQRFTRAARYTSEKVRPQTFPQAPRDMQIAESQVLELKVG